MTQPANDPSTDPDFYQKENERLSQAADAAIKKCTKLEKRAKTGLKIFLGAIVLLLVGAGGAYYWGQRSSDSSKQVELLSAELSSVKKSSQATLDEIQVKLAAAEQSATQASKTVEELATSKDKMETSYKEMVASLRKSNDELIVAKQTAEGEAKRIQDEVAVKVKAESEQKEEVERKKTRLTDQVFDSSKNYRPEGHQDLKDEDAIKAIWAGWEFQNGFYFPLVNNLQGNPGPIKGDDAPYFLSPKANWKVRKIRLENPKGQGFYVTEGWSADKKPVSK